MKVVLIEHLADIIETLKPKYLILANAFNTKSPGHFIEYKHFENSNLYESWIEYKLLTGLEYVQNNTE